MAFQLTLPALGTAVAKRVELFPPITAKLLGVTSRFAPTTRRLVVLVPNVDTNEHELARQLWAIASSRKLSVLLLGTAHDAQYEPRARRRLASLAALMRDDTVTVDTRLEIHSTWLPALQTVLQKGDLIICHAEQQAARWGIRHEPLSRILLNKLQTPICELTGFYPELPPEDPGLIAKAVVLGVPALLVVGFTALEVVVQQRTAAAPNYALLMSLCVVLEYGLIGLWCFLLN